MYWAVGMKPLDVREQPVAKARAHGFHGVKHVTGPVVHNEYCYRDLVYVNDRNNPVFSDHLRSYADAQYGFLVREKVYNVVKKVLPKRSKNELASILGLVAGLFGLDRGPLDIRLR